MQADKVCIFYFSKSIFPLLSSKGIGLSRICVKAALRAGWSRKNHPRFAPVFFLAKP